MSEALAHLQRFLREMKRRKVYRVTAGYLVAAFVVLQLVDLAAGAFGFPGWFEPMVWVLIGCALPIVVMLAWAYDVTPEGVRRTAPVDTERGSEPAPAGPASGSDAEPLDRSIAVLPFETLGQNEASTFTDGVHGDMLTRLSKVPDLKVTSRTSVLRYRKPESSLPEIARDLGVAWVLMGEIQEAGDEVQVNARLVHAVDDNQIWAERYRRELTAENLFDIQRELTEEIAAQLQVHLTREEKRLAARAPTGDLDAYRLYIRGRSQLEQWTEEEMRRAVTYFQGAIDLDPEYALAWAGLSDALSLLRWYGYASPVDAPAPEEAAEQALALAPDLAEAHASRGIVLCSSERSDGPGALRELEEAVRLRPSYAYALIWIAWLHLLLGDPEEALEPAERAAKLNPLAPAARVFLAETYLANHRWAPALREAARGRELQPEKPLSHLMEALALHHLGRFTEAETALETSLSLTPREGKTPTRSEIRAVLAVVSAARGQTDRARQQLEQIDGDAEPFSAGLVLAALGEQDAALEAFERVSDWGQLSTEYLRYFFPDVLGPLRQTPRYRELLRQADRSWGVASETGQGVG